MAGSQRGFKLTDDEDVYIPRFGWIREDWAWAEVLNRRQDVMELYFINTKSGKSRKVLREVESDAWVNVNDDFRVLKSGDRFLCTSWQDGHTHIYLYSFDRNDPLAADAKMERQLESGDYEVLEVNAVDEETGTVYFTANKDDPQQEKIFSVKLDGLGMQALSRESGRHSATFAKDSKHYVDSYSATLSPTKISFCSTTGNCAVTWKARSIADYDLIEPKWLTFKADDGTLLYGSLILPPNAANGEKIPLIDYVYGGPAGQTVTDAWGGSRILFHQMLAKRNRDFFGGQSRDAESGKEIFGSHSVSVWRRGVERPAGGAGAAVCAVSAARPGAHGDLGMVKWRVDDAVGADALGPLQGGNRRGADFKPAGLRLDLHRTVYGPAARQHEGLRRLNGERRGKSARAASAGAWDERRQCAFSEFGADDRCPD